MFINNFYIPERFSDEVSSHIVLNIIKIPNLRIPLLLGIHGPMGEGKTEQCRLVCEKMKIKLIYVDGSVFESENAGEPVRRIKKIYLNASINNGNYINSTNLLNEDHTSKYEIILINDIDQRIGRSDSLIQQTINTQLINALLMELADYPEKIDSVLRTRVPIIITGNNLKNIHRPLIRDGRMTKFVWIPSVDEKIQIVRKIFNEKTISDNEITRLVSSFVENEVRRERKEIRKDFTISTFAMLRYLLYKDEIIKMIHKVGLNNIMEHIVDGSHVSELHQPIITYKTLKHKAEFMKENDLLVDYLME